jgi:hypothetical protein
MINSPNSPDTISPWIDYKEQEESDFQYLCDYLLSHNRIDLLIHAINLRHSHGNKDTTYGQKSLNLASKESISTYQSLKCQMLAKMGNIVLDYQFDLSNQSLYSLRKIYYIPISGNERDLFIQIYSFSTLKSQNLCS